MPLIPRNKADDCAALPDSKAERAVLADFTDPRSSYFKGASGYQYERTLGDLIVDALVGRDLVDDLAQAPEVWESFEAGILARTALELKAANFGLAANGDDPDYPTDDLTKGEVCELLRGLARRTEAAVELSKRLREARWGHPHFGGGAVCTREDLDKATELGRDEARRWLTDTKSGATELSPNAWVKDAFEEPETPWAFESMGPSLDEESARNAFYAGFSREIEKHGFALRVEDIRNADVQAKTATNESAAPANDGGAS